MLLTLSTSIFQKENKAMASKLEKVLQDIYNDLTTELDSLDYEEKETGKYDLITETHIRGMMDCLKLVWEKYNENK